MNHLLDWDSRIFLLINQWHGRLGDQVFPYITRFGLFKWPLLAGGLLLLWKGGPRVRLALAGTVLAVLLADASGQALKQAVGRTRPFKSEPTARVLIRRSNSPSFPSNHAANTAAAAAFLLLAFRRRPALALVPAAVALLVAYSRVYVGVHYPLDVLAGALIGVLWGAAVFFVGVQALRWMDRRRSEPERGGQGSPVAAERKRDLPAADCLTAGTDGTGTCR